MYQVTALYQNDAEIGYGEGESRDYAIADCLDSIDSPAMYSGAPGLPLAADGFEGERYRKED